MADRRRANVFIGVAMALILGGALAYGVFAQRPRAVPVVDDLSSDIVFDASWRKLPEPADVLAAYPPKAKAARLPFPVLVDMRCVIADQGALYGCVIFNESLPDYGFGDAALKLAERFEVNTTAPDGRSLIGLVISVPLRFRPLDEPTED